MRVGIFVGTVMIGLCCILGARVAVAAPDPVMIIDPMVATDPATGETPQKRDERLVGAFKTEIAGLIQKDPQAALTRCQKFFDDHPNLYPTVADDLAITVANLYYPALKDSKNALATYNWIIKKDPGHATPALIRARADLLFHVMNDQPGAIASIDTYIDARPDWDDGLVLLEDQAKFLIEANRPNEVEGVLKARLPRLIRARTSFSSASLQRYIAILEKAGRGDEGQMLLKQMMIGNPTYLDPPSQPEGWVIDKLTDMIRQQKQTPELVKLAKLRFMVCAYSSYPIASASRSLTAAWQEADPTGKQKEDFVTSQTDAAAHNPLMDVQSPTFDPAILAVEIPKATGIRKITLAIMAGDLKTAMAVARAMQADPATAKDGTLQVCRVLKAADLNLLSAAQYLKFQRGQGTDPTLRFAK